MVRHAIVDIVARAQQATLKTTQKTKHSTRIVVCVRAVKIEHTCSRMKRFNSEFIVDDAINAAADNDDFVAIFRYIVRTLYGNKPRYVRYVCDVQ